MPAPIHYFCTGAHSYTLGIFAAMWADRIASDIKIIPYSTLRNIRRFGPGVFIFTDFDRQSEEHRGRVALLADRLGANGCRVLNHPIHSLRRYDLLRTLYEGGINRFGTYRIADRDKVRNYPVFIRSEQHGRRLTELLADAAALEQAVESLPDGGPDDLMIVEFGNARSGDGRYRKYSAYKVGAEIYASECQSCDHWWVKYSTAEDEEKDREENDRFVADNPHRDQLKAIFALAGIDYGRADYCVVDGRVQLFEINTNPTVSHVVIKAGAMQANYARRHEDALLRLLAEGSGASTTDNVLFAPGLPEHDPDSVNAALLAWGRSYWAQRWGEPRAGEGANAL